MAKHLYEIRRAVSVNNLTDYIYPGNVFYEYMDENRVSEFGSAQNPTVINSFDDLYKLCEEHRLPMVSADYTLFTHKRKVVLRWWWDSNPTIVEGKHQKYFPIKTYLDCRLCKKSFYEVAKCMSAEDFVDFCVDKGVSINVPE